MFNSVTPQQREVLEALEALDGDREFSTLDEVAHQIEETLDQPRYNDEVAAAARQCRNLGYLTTRGQSYRISGLGRTVLAESR